MVEWLMLLMKQCNMGDGVLTDVKFVCQDDVSRRGFYSSQLFVKIMSADGVLTDVNCACQDDVSRRGIDSFQLFVKMISAGGY